MAIRVDSGDKSYVIVLCKINYVVGLQTKHAEEE